METVLFFLQLQTQWQITQNAYAGLNYPSVIELMRLYEVKNMRSIFEDIQVMEIAALKILNGRDH